MDVFDISASASFFRDAAVAAAYALGIYDGRSASHTRRMQQLLDLLAGFGVLDAPPPRVTVPPGGWGDLADVIRRDTPLPANDAETRRRMHEHLARVGADAAAEVAALLPPPSLVDLGGGAGAYTKAYLARHPAARATLVDIPEVVALAREHLGERVELVASDIRDVRITDASVALLANVLHLHGPEVCAELVGVAARCVAPGGRVVLKDLRMDDGRSGPLASLVFAMNMGLYTEAGDVYETSQLRGWLEAAGLVDIEEHRLATSPDAIVVSGRRP